MVDDKDPNEFLAAASKGRQGVLGELWHMLATTKRWWLTPIVLLLIALGILLILGSTGAAPFIYTIF